MSESKVGDMLISNTDPERLSRGCHLCGEGQKMVLFVTGLCEHSCAYCPISEKKRGKDVVYANEKLVESDSDIIFEARAIGAGGTGITGGSPLLVLDRVLGYIKLLKKEFGSKHHIHLYTQDFTDESAIGILAEAGLDEIRFHLGPDAWLEVEGHHIMTLARLAQETDMRVGFEVPVPPDKRDGLEHLIRVLDEAKISFVNLNEFEISETNWDTLYELGYEPADDLSNSVAGSRALALEIIETLDVDIPIHFCSSWFKDAVQLRNRLKRRAENTARDYYFITDDGTFIKGVIECPDAKALLVELMEKYDIPENLIGIDTEKCRLEVAPWILEEIAPELEHPCYIIEEYPTSDRLEVEKMPLFKTN